MAGALLQMLLLVCDWRNVAIIRRRDCCFHNRPLVCQATLGAERQLLVSQHHNN